MTFAPDLPCMECEAAFQESHERYDADGQAIVQDSFLCLPCAQKYARDFLGFLGCTGT